MNHQPPVVVAVPAVNHLTKDAVLTGVVKSQENKSMKKSAQNSTSYTSTMSKDDEYSHSTSYDDSHSDYDSNYRKKKSTAPPQQAVTHSGHKASSKNPPPMLLHPKSVLSDLVVTQQSLLPRPETLAVLSHDLFAEKCASNMSRQSSIINLNLNNIANSNIITSSNINNRSTPVKTADAKLG